MARNLISSSEAPLIAVASSTPARVIDLNHNSDTQLLNAIDQKPAVDQELGLLQLPSDFAKTPLTTYRPSYHTFSLPDCLVESLKAQAQQENVTVRSLLLAAFKALLHRYTHQEAISLELLTLNRSLDQVHTTELNSLIQDELSIRALVDHISTAPGIIAQENSSDIAASNSQQHLNLSIVASFLEQTVSIEELTLRIVEAQERHHHCINDLDLHLVLLQQEQGMVGLLIYNANLFTAGTLQRLSDHFQVMLTEITHNLDQSIAQLPLLTPAEEHQLLVDWNSPSVTYPPRPIHQQVEAWATQTPNQIAVTCKTQQLTYAELTQRANQLAHYLNSLGVGAGDRVAVCVQPCLEIAVSVLGILKAGGVYVPLDPTHPQDRLTAILKDTQATVLLTQAALRSSLPSIAAHTVCLDQNWHTIDSFPSHTPETEISLDQIAYIIYTSGTTGKPKGVMASHRNLVNYILATQDRLGFDQTDVMPSIARYTFSIAIFELFSPLVAGGTLVLLEREHFLDFARMTQTLEQLTMLHTVPSLMQKLLGYITEKGLDLQKFQGVKHVFTGGDTVSPELLEEMKRIFPNAKVAVLYGCSEVSSLCTTYPVPRDRTITKSRIGKPFNNVSVRLYDSQQNLVPIGVLGEIYVGGAGVTSGYLNREELTQEKFVTIDGQRFYRTGDLGRWDAEGNLEFLGRADFQIKLRGIRIELGDIEATLRQAPGVREGIVMAREFGGGEKRLVAYLVLDQAQSPLESIHHFLQAKLPDYMVPAAFVVLEAMPLNPNQKVDRRALPLPTAENLIGLQTVIAPHNQVEQQLVEIWETVLGIQPIGVQNDFFELGGDSLLAVQMFAQIEQQFGRSLPLSTLLSAPTIEQLAAILQPNQTHLQNSLVLLKAGQANAGQANAGQTNAGQAKPPLFLIHDGDGETLLYRSLAYALDPALPVYGIQPASSNTCPIFHTRIVDLVNHYIEQIRRVQPQGPYFLGGMCVGGILAFEIALQLQKQGQPVEMIAIIDAADVEATPRTGYVTNQRLSSFSKVLSGNDQLKPHERLVYILSQVSKKATNLVAYETQKRIENLCDQIQLNLLRNYLDRGLSIPKFLQSVSVRKVLVWTQQSYVPQGLFQGNLLLFRATQKSSIFDGTQIDDTPYTELYSDPLLGWGKRVTEEVKVHDIPGGHSSMLQKPNVQDIAEVIQAYMNKVIP